MPRQFYKIQQHSYSTYFKLNIQALKALLYKLIWLCTRLILLPVVITLSHLKKILSFCKNCFEKIKHFLWINPTINFPWAIGTEGQHFFNFKHILRRQRLTSNLECFKVVKPWDEYETFGGVHEGMYCNSWVFLWVAIVWLCGRDGDTLAECQDRQVVAVRVDVR